MNRSDKRFEEIERRLLRVRLAEPPAELKMRIVGAAEKAWQEAPADIPWRIPLRHLGLSAAAAVLIVSGANYFSVQAVAPWQADRLAAAPPAYAEGSPSSNHGGDAHDTEEAGSEDMPEVLYSPFVRNLLALGQSPAQNVAALLDYMQSVRKALNSTEQDDAAEGSGPGKHESRLPPAGTIIDWYS